MIEYNQAIRYIVGRMVPGPEPWLWQHDKEWENETEARDFAARLGRMSGASYDVFLMRRRVALERL